MRLFWELIVISFCTSCSPLVSFMNQDKRTRNISCYHDGNLCSQSALHKVPGLISIIEESDYMDIYLVHGMTTHSEKYYNEFVSTIGNKLGYHELVAKDILSGKEADSPKLIYTIYKSKSTNKYLRFFYVNWSPATQLYKERIASNYRSNIDKRTGIRQAKFNRELKQTLIHDGFADITALLSPEIQKKIFCSFEWVVLLSSFHPSVFLDRTNEINLDAKNIQKVSQKNKAIISGSFGTKLVQEFFRNYILQLNIDGNLMTDVSDLTLYGQKKEFVISNLDYIRNNIKSYVNGLDSMQYYWYSLSNQLVLLDAMRLNMHRSNSDVKEQSDIISQRLRSNTNLVSFHDPNDLLGFHIPGKDHFGNIYAKNVWNIVSPSASRLFFSIANPNKAHTGSRTNESLISIICFGYK